MAHKWSKLRCIHSQPRLPRPLHSARRDSQNIVSVHQQKNTTEYIAKKSGSARDRTGDLLGVNEISYH